MQVKFDWRLIAVALLAGASIGFAGSRIAYRLRLLHPPVEGAFDRMSAELKLTDEQREAARQAILQARDQINQEQKEFEEKRRDLLSDAYLKIRAELRPEQQALLDRDFVPPSMRLRAQTLVQAQSHPVASPAVAATP